MKRTVPLLNDIVVRVSRKAIAVILFILVFSEYFDFNQ
jgi:hypothetical protein